MTAERLELICFFVIRVSKVFNIGFFSICEVLNARVLEWDRRWRARRLLRLRCDLVKDGCELPCVVGFRVMQEVEAGLEGGQGSGVVDGRGRGKPDDGGGGGNGGHLGNSR